MSTAIVKANEGPGPFGAKAVGEAGISLVAPAIANAVADATGIRIKEMPITAEKIFRAGSNDLTDEPANPSTKFETRNNIKSLQCSKLYSELSFELFRFPLLKLFRISIFEFRNCNKPRVSKFSIWEFP